MMIRHNKPYLSFKDKISVLKVLQSGFISAGQQVSDFERSVAQYLGNGYACAVSNGTSAIYLSLYALGIKPEDEIILPTYTCSALLNAVYMISAKPVLADVNQDDFNISFESAKKLLTAKTKAIIIPHVYGVPADLDRFKTLNVPIIEDCAQSIGAEYKTKRTGSVGDIAVFSFYATKLLATGYGGMIYARNKQYIDRIRDYVNFDHRQNYYPRFNFQMSDMQAALGLSQFNKLHDFLKRREDIADRYIAVFKQNNLQFQQMTVMGKRVYYRIVIRIDKPYKLVSFLAKAGIQAIVPIESWELLHKYLKLSPENFSIAEQIAHSTISLPIYPALKDKETKYVMRMLLRGLEYAR